MKQLIFDNEIILDNRDALLNGKLMSKISNDQDRVDAERNISDDATPRDVE